MSESAIDALRAGINEHIVEPHPLLCVGQMARIRSGAFAGMSGVVLRKKSGCRVVLTMEQIMQSVAVEVDESELECIAPERPDIGRPFDIDARMGWQKAS